MSNMRLLYRKSLRKEALAMGQGQNPIAPAERVKQKMIEVKSQQTKALFEAIEKFISDAKEESVPDMLQHARKTAGLIPPVAEMYDSPDEVDIRIRLSDLYVWLSAIENAPSQKLSTALDTIKNIYDELVVDFSSGTE